MVAQEFLVLSVGVRVPAGLPFAFRKAQIPLLDFPLRVWQRVKGIRWWRWWRRTENFTQWDGAGVCITRRIFFKWICWRRRHASVKGI
jgi:hypothetical protein